MHYPIPLSVSSREALVTAEVEQLRAEIDGLRKEKDELNSEHSREVTRLERCLSVERLDMEQKYKLEMTDCEDTYMKEKELIIKSFTKQKVCC